MSATLANDTKHNPNELDELELVFVPASLTMTTARVRGFSLGDSR